MFRIVGISSIPVHVCPRRRHPRVQVAGRPAATVALRDEGMCGTQIRSFGEHGPHFPQSETSPVRPLAPSYRYRARLHAGSCFHRGRCCGIGPSCRVPSPPIWVHRFLELELELEQVRFESFLVESVLWVCEFVKVPSGLDISSIGRLSPSIHKKHLLLWMRARQRIVLTSLPSPQTISASPFAPAHFSLRHPPGPVDEQRICIFWRSPTAHCSLGIVGKRTPKTSPNLRW